MFRLSNNFILLLNFATLLLSIPIIMSANWLAKNPNDCDKWIQTPIMVFGVLILALSAMGMVGVCCSCAGCLWMYLFFMYLLMLALFAFSIFSIVVMNKSVSKAVEGIGYDEYKLGDYSNWLQNRVENQNNWKKILSCLKEGEVCAKIEDPGPNHNESIQAFYHQHLSAAQAGCCKPSPICEFQYKSPLVWIKGDKVMTFKDKDCDLWNNNQDVLCYNCESCKAGVLESLRDGWIKAMFLNSIVLFVLCIIYSIGCCAYKNETRSYYNRPYYY